jgi:hypothetical protein
MRAASFLSRGWLAGWQLFNRQERETWGSGVCGVAGARELTLASAASERLCVCVCVSIFWGKGVAGSMKRRRRRCNAAAAQHTTSCFSISPKRPKRIFRQVTGTPKQRPRNVRARSEREEGCVRSHHGLGSKRERETKTPASDIDPNGVKARHLNANFVALTNGTLPLRGA